MLDHLISLIQREIDMTEHSILAGGCPDYTAYREQIAALNALRYSIDLAKRAFREEGDE